MFKKKAEHNFGGISPFKFMVSYSENYGKYTSHSLEPHAHGECEIYINLAGDVSFMVENRVYPIERGSVIITRPNEFHHCIYNTEKSDHSHFWILFSPNGNEQLLELFFNRDKGRGNLISLTRDKLKRVCDICDSLLDKSIPQLEAHLCFLQLIKLLSNEKVNTISDESEILSPDVLFALNFIQTNLTSGFTVSEIARAAHVSVNTLERHFAEQLNISPSELIKKRRLALAKTLLKEGKSVGEASAESGFNDYSRFISLFKATYGITPLKYKKS